MFRCTVEDLVVSSFGRCILCSMRLRSFCSYSNGFRCIYVRIYTYLHHLMSFFSLHFVHDRKYFSVLRDICIVRRSDKDLFLATTIMSASTPITAVAIFV